ncbi:MAG: FtsQ-type POTRA domain-containing protein [Candidatus Edwardsbacteria bacterium]|jgi:hypothetical protein|nr:FtsQ-type POTRA domain-containing protein [Candidatus Edwardsbacteria bacterium]
MIRPYFDRSEARRVRAQGRRRTLRTVIVAVLLAAAAAALGRAGFTRAARRGWFDIDEVTVSGNRLVPAAEIAAVARRWVGRPVWSVDRRRLAAALRQRCPAVGEVSCGLRPWWTLALTVRERSAVARIECDPAAVVSPEGVFFRDSSRAGLPALRIAGTSDIGRMRAISAIIACPAPSPDWLFDPTDPRDIRVLAGGAVVHLGDGDFGAVWAKHREISLDLERNGAAAADIDLRFRDQGVVVLRDPPAAAGN